MQLNIVIGFDEATLSLVKRAVGLLKEISTKEDTIMATMQDDVDAIAAQTTHLAGLTVLIQGLQDKINALPGITPAMQAQIDTVFDGIDANTKSIDAAMLIGVPPAPPPVVVPPVVS